MQRDDARAAGGNEMPRRLQAQGRTPVVIGHRGARALAPENTLPSIDKAFALGAHMVEVDVHLSSDGDLFVVHDEDLCRCSDARTRFPGRTSYLVPDFRSEEIAQLDAGGWLVEAFGTDRSAGATRPEPFNLVTPEERASFVSAADLERYASGAVHPPLLSDCLEATRAAGRQINIEIKTIPMRCSTIATRVVRLIEGMRMEEAAIVSSFYHEQLVEVRAVSRRIATAVLTRDPLDNPAGYLRLLDADAFHPCCERADDPLGLDASGRAAGDMIERLHHDGFAVHAWTANDPARIRALIAAGADGIVTDFPNRVRDIVRAVKHT